MPITQIYHANGKLLLTSEYFVLHGAKSLALPLKVGQQLTVSEDFASDSLIWQAFYNGQVWFSCQLNPSDFSVIATNHPGKAETLSKIFQTIKKLNPGFQPKSGTRMETSLDANPEWGFGSSSTLISLLSQWAKVDPFKLNELVFNGSRFDIACAMADGPIFYIKNQPYQPVELDYPFAEQLFLVYSGKKKITNAEVNSFLKEKNVSVRLIDEVTALTEEFFACQHQNKFNELIRRHERIVGKLIGQVPVKEQFFADFNGEIKSLGAWGGDFYLISTVQPFSEVKKYFDNLGLTTIFSWNDLILKRENK